MRWETSRDWRLGSEELASHRHILKTDNHHPQFCLQISLFSDLAQNCPFYLLSCLGWYQPLQPWCSPESSHISCLLIAQGSCVFCLHGNSAPEGRWLKGRHWSLSAPCLKAQGKPPFPDTGGTWRRVWGWKHGISREQSWKYRLSPGCGGFSRLEDTTLQLTTVNGLIQTEAGNIPVKGEIPQFRDFHIRLRDPIGLWEHFKVLWRAKSFLTKTDLPK